MSKVSDSRPYGSPFISPEAPSLAEAIERLEHITDLKPSRRRDLKSALRSIARLIGRREEEIPANINWLHIRLRRIAPAAHNITKKRFANIKSDALKALELTGCSRERSDWLRPPSPSWQALLDRIESKHDLWKLKQLAQYCSALNVEPQEVTNEHLRGLLKSLIEESFVNRPEHIAANAAKTWNRLREEITDWPQTTLSSPRKKDPWTIPIEDFPSSFGDDVERWIERLSNPDLLDPSGPIKPLRPSTIKHRKFQIREMASALVRSDFPIADVTSLSVLVDIQNFKAGLRWMLKRFGEKPTEAIHGLAMGIKAIARHHVKVDDAQLEEMRSICQRLNRESDDSREKNRMKLLQLEDQHNLAILLHLPEALLQRSRRAGIRPHKAALLVQAALAIEILLYAPMRVGNLATLDLERHLRQTRFKRERRIQISIPGKEVKNGKPLHYELGPTAVRLFDHYMKEARPVLLRAPSDYLFPAQNGGPKASNGLSNLIKFTIRDHTGLDINTHLFRSIAGKLHSLVAPGDFTTLSHVLHNSLRTAMKTYAQFVQKSSMEHYQRSVDDARRRLKPKPNRRKTRK